MKLSIRRTVAAVASAAAATALLTTAPPATALPIETLKVDADTFVLYQPTFAAGASGTATVTLQGGNVQVLVNAKVVKASSVAGCRAVRALFTYADGSTATTAPSARVCKEHETTSLDVTLRSSTSKDLVKYALQFLTATDDDAPVQVVDVSNQLVGDAPDSYGTTVRLDHDTHKVAKDGQIMFNGSANWSLNKHTVESAGFSWWNVRARVTGTLVWKDLMPGHKAWLKVTWTYTDGSTARSQSAYVERDRTESVPVSLVSDSFKEVVSARVYVASDGTTSPNLFTGNSTKFGDFGGVA